MARVPGISTVAPKPWRVLQGPGALSVGAVASNDPGNIGATIASVGLTDSSISWNPNLDVEPLLSDQMYNPHGMVETAWAHQFSLSLDQVDIYNIALAMSYDQDAVSASSMLYLDGYKPSPYRCVQIEMEAPKDSADDAQATQYIDIFKAKVVSDGAMDIGRTAKSTLPITIHGIANSSDIVGTVRTGQTITIPSYE
jgi:hypothetical protein